MATTPGDGTLRKMHQNLAWAVGYNASRCDRRRQP
jgi:cation transport ATPase